MSKPELVRIISKENKGVGEAKSPLSILYRKILYDLGITPEMMLNTLERFIHDPAGPVKQTQKKRSQARGNYIKKFNDPVMTWKSFMDLLLMLYPEKITISIRPTWSDGTITEHDLTLNSNLLTDSNAKSSHLTSLATLSNRSGIDGTGRLTSITYDRANEASDESDDDDDDDDDDNAMNEE